jgi:5-methyltetrahydrofolate--homocysteine methyltransferase
MTTETVLDALSEALVNMNIEAARKACQQALIERISPLEVINRGLVPGMQIVGEKFQAEQYFLTDLIAAAAVMQEAMKILQPHIKKDEQGKKLGTIVLGTVEGDLHDLGKNIVSMLMSVSGFEVIDLGVDVPPSKFVEAIQTHRPRLLGMSALITSTMPAMAKVIGELDRAGLRAQLRIIVGGAPLSEQYAKTIGADAFASDAVIGVNLCKKWATEGNIT